MTYPFLKICYRYGRVHLSIAESAEKTMVIRLHPKEAIMIGKELISASNRAVPKKLKLKLRIMK